jgi:hypothetical protein
MSLYKLSKGRCWDGYEPVPGKDAYSDGSCRPVGSKKKKKDKKKEKSASDCGSHKSSSLMDKLNLIKFNYTQPKQASLEDLNTERFVKLLDFK